MPTLKDALSGAAAAPASRPWPRFIVTPDLWRDLPVNSPKVFGRFPECGAMSAWFMALVDAKAGQIAIVSLVCDGGRFPSVAAFMLRRRAWSARSRTCSATSRSARRISVHGSTMGVGRFVIRSARERQLRPKPRLMPF